MTKVCTSQKSQNYFQGYGCPKFNFSKFLNYV